VKLNDLTRTQGELLTNISVFDTRQPHFFFNFNEYKEYFVYLYPSYNTGDIERKHINRIRVVLAEKNMTNKQLAELVGKGPIVVSKWVTNKMHPNVYMLIQIAKMLEVSVDELPRTE